MRSPAHLDFDVTRHPLYGPLFAQALEHLRPILRTGGAVLDIGCGDAAKTAALARLGAHASGVDVNPEAIACARALYPEIDLRVGSSEGLPWADASFDAAFSCSVLQYVEPELHLREMARLVRAGGRIALIENLHGSPFAQGWRVLHRALGWPYPPNMVPRRHLTLPWLRSLLVADFTEVSLDVWYLAALVPWAPRFLRRRLLGTPLPPTPPLGTDTLHRLDRWVFGHVPGAQGLGFQVVVRAVRR